MQPLKYAEQLVHIFHIEPDTVVLDVVGHRLRARVVRHPPDFDSALIPILSVLESIGE